MIRFDIGVYFEERQLISNRRMGQMEYADAILTFEGDNTCVFCFLFFVGHVPSFHDAHMTEGNSLKKSHCVGPVATRKTP